MDKDIETMIAEIEARAAKATPGPWKPKVVSSYYGTNGVSAGSCEDVVGMHGASAANCDFIAHAREDVPTLCAMWREAVAERDALRERLRIIQSTDNKNLDAKAEALADLFAGKNIDGCIATEDEIIAVRKPLSLSAKERQTLATRLKAAIRRQTVDVDDGNTPNGPVEQAMETVAHILNSTTFVATAKTSRRMLIETFARLSAAMAADCKELREAADAYFGEDFTRPPPPTQP